LAELNSAYMKYIKNKVNPYNIIKSNSSVSNTLAAIYRMIYLKNNYCLYNSDKILYIANSSILLDKIKNIYDKLINEIEPDYVTLFSFIGDKVDFLTVKDLKEYYCKSYISKNASHLKLITNESERIEIIKSCLDIVKEEYKNLKLYKKDYINFISDEIKWMKTFEYIEIDEYQNCVRNGRRYKRGEGPLRLLKNSKERESIYKLFTLYQDKLSAKNLFDYEDADKFALIEAQNRKRVEYTHIFVDECEVFTKNQLQLVSILKNAQTYGETNYLYNKSSILPLGAFLVKPNKLSEINVGQKLKSYYFKKPFEKLIELQNDLNKKVHKIEEDLTMNNNNLTSKKDYSIENYEFVSLKYGKEFKFIRDISRKDSIVLLDNSSTHEIKPNEMRELPLFTNIAAGEPILMNPDVEDTFYLPEMWLKGLDNHFILKVKGDSMIGAGINDGDYVVIRSTPSAQNRDIVAVDLDGNATLKRLKIKKNEVLLMPENEKYSPIPIGEDGVHILGTAVGILKKN
jgi:SOS regulatory protein LexA